MMLETVLKPLHSAAAQTEELDIEYRTASFDSRLRSSLVRGLPV